MAVHAQAPIAAVPSPIGRAARLYGFGSVFGKTVRDSRAGALAVAAVLAGILLAGGAAMANTYGTIEARRELESISANLPPVMAGLYGNPVNVDTLGGFVSWHYGSYVALLAGLWSILALSSTLASEARRGSLEFLASTPLPRVRIALEKVAGHLLALAVAMMLVGLAAWVSGRVFAVMPGDEISPTAAAGFAVGIGVKALLAGSLAFAVASFLGRGAAVGIAGSLMLAGYVTNAYRSVIPAFDAVAGASWFAWTADHLPLAGRWDWAAVAFTALVALVLLGIGIAAFVRRDIGVTPGTRGLGLPRLLLGVRGPVSRSVGELLPLALAWGAGLGLFGLVMAAASRAFADEIAKVPGLIEAVRGILPRIDMTTPAGFLQLVFADFGFVLVGLAAATLVAERWGDESSGRLELQLATPLTRARWAFANAAGVWIAILLLVALVAIALAIGVAAAGGDIGTPVIGLLALALYGMALGGLGLAVGGVVGASSAGPVVAVAALATFLVDMLGPALDLPDWLVQLALTTHMGEPIIGTWDVAGLAACVVIAVGGLAVGLWGISRRDIGG